MSVEGFFGPKEGNLVDMIQMWGLAKTTGVLTIKSGREEGEIHFLEGRAVFSKAGPYLKNEDAVYHILAMEEGKFRFINTVEVRRNGSLNASFQELILEGMRKLDHLKNAKKDLDEKLGFIPTIQNTVDEAQLSDEERIFVGLVDGKRNLEKVFSHCGLGVHKSFDVYRRLSSKGVVGLRKLRVLVVDDQPMWCKVISNMLLKEPYFEIAAVAEDGVEALRMLSELKPDVMTLDLEMPRMDGIKTLYWMMSGGYDILLKSHYNITIPDTYRCPVVVISAVATKMAPQTLDALLGGATGYITKPSQLEADSLDVQQKRIAKTVLMASQVDLMKSRRIRVYNTENKRNAAESAEKIVCVGASMVGGLTSLMQFIPQLPANLDSAVFVVIDDLHSVEHARSFAEFLDRHSQIRVEAADKPALLKKGCVYIAPGCGKVQFGLARVGEKLKTAYRLLGSENPQRPLDEMLFGALRSKGFHKRVGVVLAGDGADGKIGFLEMAKIGDRVFAQDSYSSLNPIKPENVANTGIARIVPLGAMVKNIFIEIGRSG